MRAVLDSSAKDEVRRAVYNQGARNLPEGPPLEMLLAASRDQDFNIRVQVIQDLAQVGHPQAIELAIEYAKEGPKQVQVMPGLLGVLGAEGSPECVEAMLALLEDSAPMGEVLGRAVELLRPIRAPKSVQMLLRGLQAKDSAIQILAAQALAGNPQRQGGGGPGQAGQKGKGRGSSATPSGGSRFPGVRKRRGRAGSLRKTKEATGAAFRSPACLGLLWVSES